MNKVSETCETVNRPTYFNVAQKRRKKGAENIFEETMAENFPNFMKTSIYRFKKFNKS